VIASLTATAMLAIGVLLFGDFGDTSGKIVLTTALLSAASLLGMPGAALLDARRAVWLGWLTLALAGYSLVHSLLLLWTDEETGWKVLLTAVFFTVACSQASATTSRMRDADPRSVRLLWIAGMGGSFLAALLASVAAWAEVDSEGYYRVLAAVAVAVLLATLLQPILRRAAREGTEPQRFVLGLMLLDGRQVERTVEAPDFAEACASAIRELEGSGERVVRVERR
jgi:uncharacterized membrane protein YhaH (DUF805 family)